MGGRLLLLLLLLPALARAGGDATDADPDTEVARKHFARGSEFYRIGRYEEALREFESSRRAKGLAPLDYNIGRCLDRLERYREAIEAYRRYLDGAYAAPDATEVRDRVAVLEQRLAEEAAARSRTPPVEGTARHGSYVAPALVGALALATAATSLGIYYGSVVPDYDALASGPTSCRPCAPSQYEGVQSRAYASYALGAIAGVAAAVDLVLWIYQARRGGGRIARLSLRGTF
jgi:tetratricopeptide (TPR) repeat protein